MCDVLTNRDTDFTRCYFFHSETAAKYMEVVPEVLSFINDKANRTSKTIRHMAIKGFSSNLNS